MRRALVAVVAAFIVLAILPSSALAIPRDVVITRGKVWANYVRTVKGKKVAGVPYSQARYALESGALLPTSTASPSTKGYRTDCSGFASMCLNLRDSKGHPYSSCTAEMGAKGSKKFYQVTKAQLQPGDMMLASAVWGATSPHAIIFAGWVDAAQTQFWALEQTSSSAHNGTILHPRAYGQKYFRPYRYAGIEDPYLDVEESINGVNAYSSAAAGSEAAFPTTHGPVPALVVASAKQWGDQISGAALAGALGGPVLLTGPGTLPASTTAEIKRLKPTRVYVLGSGPSVSVAAASQIAQLGASVTRIYGTNRYQIAARVAPKTVAEGRAAGHPADRVYIAPGGGTAEALAIAPIAAKTGSPILYTGKAALSKAGVGSLALLHIKRVVIVGGTSVVSKSVDKQLRRLGYRVERIGDKDGYRTSAVVAAYALKLNIGFTWNRVGVAAPASCADALAYCSSFGRTNSLLVLTPTGSLNGTVRVAILRHRTQVGRARVLGSAVSAAVRKRLAIALRSGK